MSHNDSPHNIISNAVVTMNHIVARINYSSGCCNFYLGREFKQPVHCFANYCYVTLDSATQT